MTDPHVTRAQRRNAERAERNLAARSVPIQLADPEAARPRVATRTQLEVLQARGSIAIAQARAGSRIYADWYRSGSAPRVTANVSRLIGDPIIAAGPEAQFKARQAYEQAIQAVGVILSPVVVHVCLLDLPAGEWAKQVGKPEPDGIAALRLGLDALVGHYGNRATVELGQA